MWKRSYTGRGNKGGGIQEGEIRRGRNRGRRRDRQWRRWKWLELWNFNSAPFGIKIPFLVKTMWVFNIIIIRKKVAEWRRCHVLVCKSKVGMWIHRCVQASAWKGHTLYVFVCVKEIEIEIERGFWGEKEKSWMCYLFGVNFGVKSLGVLLLGRLSKVWPWKMFWRSKLVHLTGPWRLSYYHHQKEMIWCNAIESSTSFLFNATCQFSYRVFLYNNREGSVH